MEIKLLIADDHAFTLQGMQRSFEQQDGFNVVATTQSALEAVSLAKLHSPDLALLDYQMADATGQDAAAEILRWSPNTRIIIITGRTDTGFVPRLIQIGIKGVLSKGSDITTVVDAARLVLKGQTVIGPEFEAAKDDETAAALSPREYQVLNCIAQGLTNSQTADKLGISPKTVESHRASVMRKLGATSAASLLVQAAQKGLVEF